MSRCVAGGGDFDVRRDRVDCLVRFGDGDLRLDPVVALVVGGDPRVRWDWWLFPSRAEVEWWTFLLFSSWGGRLRVSPF